MNTAILITAAILAVIAITFSIIALVKSVDNEKYIDDIYELAEDLDALLDKIIATIGLHTDDDDELREIEKLAHEIKFDENGKPVIPEELKKKLTPEQLKNIEHSLECAYRIGEKFKEFAQAIEEHIERENVRPAQENHANRKKSGKTAKYDDTFKAEVLKYAAENPDSSAYAVAKHFGISKNTVKRWTAKQ